jgi:hypothetical protein
MADLDDVVQKILIEGDQEVLGKLSEIAEKGSEFIKELSEASEKGVGGFELLADAIGGIGSALFGATVAVAAFVDGQDEAIQKTNFLAKAFGATTGELSGLEQAFAQAGVSTVTFEQFAQRLTTTIAREWPSITESIRTSSTAQESAQERVVAATIRVSDAQMALGRTSEETGSKIANANIRAGEAYVRLQFAASAALATMQHNINSVAAANLGLESAQQRLAELQGRPVSAEEKKALEIKQAQLAVDTARQAVTDANNKKLQDQAEAASKKAAAAQAAIDAQLKSETVYQEALNARAKAENLVKEAITAKAEAQEHASQQLLKDIPTISTALDGIAKGSKTAAEGIDLTQVSVQNLTKGIIAAAAAGSSVEPTGLKVMAELSGVLSSKQADLISSSQKLAIVQQLSQRGYASTSVAAFELLAALERGPAFFDKFTAAQNNAFANTHQAAENVKEFRDALALLGNTISLVNKNFAAAASPLFTEFLNAIDQSLTKSNGTLHLFVQGLQAIGSVIGIAVEGFKHLFESIDHAFHLEEGRAFQVFLGVCVVLVGALANAFLGIPAVLAVIGVAIGFIAQKLPEIGKFVEDNKAKFVALGLIIGAAALYFAPWTTALGLIIAGVVLIVEHWDEIKTAVEKTWESLKSSVPVVAMENFIAKLKTAYEWVKKIGEALPTWLGGKAAQTGTGENGALAAPDGGSTVQPGLKLAGGGHVRGAGTSTSDSIFASLSDGEFVSKTAAVQKYGVDFFHSLNNMTFPGFAQGGLVGAPARIGGSGAGPIQASRALNLTIDGRTFSGFRGPASVVDSLSSYAVARQTSSAGRQPSWVK